MVRLKGSLIMSRPSYSDGREAMSIRLTDEDAGVGVVEIEMSHPEFVKALTSSNGECEFEFNDTGTVGKLRERKQEIVVLPEGSSFYDLTSKGKAEILGRLAVDGWRPRKDDLTNRHRQTKTADGRDQVSVTCVRWVDKPQAEEAK